MRDTRRIEEGIQGDIRVWTKAEFWRIRKGLFSLTTYRTKGSARRGGRGERVEDVAFAGMDKGKRVGIEGMIVDVWCIRKGIRVWTRGNPRDKICI